VGENVMVMILGRKVMVMRRWECDGYERLV
jgi:hypothetical protein